MQVLYSDLVDWDWLDDSAQSMIYLNCLMRNKNSDLRLQFVFGPRGSLLPWLLAPGSALDYYCSVPLIVTVWLFLDSWISSSQELQALARFNWNSSMSRETQRSHRFANQYLTNECEARVNWCRKPYIFRCTSEGKSINTDCSQLPVFSYFCPIVERVDRIARQLDASAKRKTWLDRQTPSPHPHVLRARFACFFFHVRRA